MPSTAALLSTFATIQGLPQQPGAPSPAAQTLSAAALLLHDSPPQHEPKVASCSPRPAEQQQGPSPLVADMQDGAAWLSNAMSASSSLSKHPQPSSMPEMLPAQQQPLDMPDGPHAVLACQLPLPDNSPRTEQQPKAAEQAAAPVLARADTNTAAEVLSGLKAKATK